MNLNDVKWGSYNGFEGPLFWGSKKFVLPSTPTDNHKILATITATEGGSLDAINAYDRCILSVGLIQWCEARYYLTSNLLGHMADKDPALMGPLKPALDAADAVFRKNPAGKWRFFAKGREVVTSAEQQKLFLLNSNGLVGSWDERSKERARLWVWCAANTLAQEPAIQAQIDFTAARVKTFATPPAKVILFDDPAPSAGWVGAIRAAYCSFAANLPAVAGKQLVLACQASQQAKWSPAWGLDILRGLTFGPGIAIYPERYNKIRPVIESLYGVNLPDFAQDLQTTLGTPQVANGSPSFNYPREIQQLLIELGYDLGPAGPDGKFGGKSRDALRKFQSLNQLDPDGNPGPRTCTKLKEAWHRLNP